MFGSEHFRTRLLKKDPLLNHTVYFGCLLCCCPFWLGCCVARASRGLGSGVGTVALTLVSLLWMILTAPGWWHFPRKCIVRFSDHFSRPCVSRLNPSSEGRPGIRVVSCKRLVPAGVAHVCTQCLLSHKVQPLSPVSLVQRNLKCSV